jgi:hypothetical protein
LRSQASAKRRLEIILYSNQTIQSWAKLQGRMLNTPSHRFGSGFKRTQVDMLVDYFVQSVFKTAR